MGQFAMNPARAAEQSLSWRPSTPEMSMCQAFLMGWLLPFMRLTIFLKTDRLLSPIH